MTAHDRSARRATVSLAACVMVLLGVTGVAILAQAGDEPVPALRARDLLPASVAKGPHHAVAETVSVDGYFYVFEVTSDFGPFTAVGRSALTTRIDEIRAIAALQDVSKSKVFLEAAGGAVVDIGKGAASAVEHPVDTAKGIGGGIKRFGVNLGRASQRAVTGSGEADTGESAAETTANTVLGVSAAMRRWAQKVAADPYTTNVVLRKALESIADVDAAGSIAAKLAVPVPRVVGTVSEVGDLVWSKDPEELRKLNEQRVKALGVVDKDAAAFFRNGWFTLTLQTRLVAALDAVKVPGCADYLASASAAETEREAQFFVESAEMLGRFHRAEVVSRLLDDSRAVVARTGSRAVLLAPIDYVHSTTAVRDALREVAARANRELQVKPLELRITGRATDRAKRDIRGFGWTIVEGAPGR